MFLGLFSKRWETYYYIIDESIKVKALEIKKAIKIFENLGFSLKFIKLKSGYSVSSYVRIVLSHKSCSYVGCYQGQNTIELTHDASLGTIFMKLCTALVSS